MPSSRRRRATPDRGSLPQASPPPLAPQTCENCRHRCRASSEPCARTLRSRKPPPSPDPDLRARQGRCRASISPRVSAFPHHRGGRGRTAGRARLAVDGGPAASRGGRVHPRRPRRRSPLRRHRARCHFHARGDHRRQAGRADPRLDAEATSVAVPSRSSLRRSACPQAAGRAGRGPARGRWGSAYRGRWTSTPACRSRRRSCRVGRVPRAGRALARAGCPVLLDNDVNVMALGEQHTGVARSASRFLFVKIGTGIGCGIVVDRHLYRAPTAAPGTSVTSASSRAGRCAPAGTGDASRPSSVVPRWRVTPRLLPRRDGPRCCRSCSSGTAS